MMQSKEGFNEEALRFENRKREKDFCSLVKLAFYSCLAPVRLDDLLDDRQSQTCAAGCPVTGFIRPVKPFEDKGQIFRRDSAARVFNHYFNLRVVLGGANFNGSARRHMSNGIV